MLSLESRYRNLLMSEGRQYALRQNSQSGLDLSGLATTIPEAAPDAQDPAEPMLHRMPAKAMGLSVAMNESTERFRISASRCLTRLGSGMASTACRARLPARKRELKEYMMGWM